MPASVSAPCSLLTSGEKLFSPAAIAKLVPSHRDASHLNASTIFRWIVRGVRTPAGEIVKLEAVKLGCFWRTSLEAVERFSVRLTAASTPSPEGVSPAPTPKQRQRAAIAASRRADAIFGSAK